MIKLGNIAWDIEVECPVTPIDATATALACTQALEAQEAAAEAVVPSMAGESAVVTTVPVRWVHPAKIYFDQERLWFYDGNKLIALDPESKKVVVGPVALGSDLESMVFNGKQLWILQYQGDLPIRLRPLNVESGKLGPAIEIGSASEGLSFLGDLVYDGRLLWFWTGMGSKAVDSPKRRELQSIDPSLLRLLPPVEIMTEEQINLVVDQARQVLWIITDDGQVQQFDLQQNVLRPTTMQFMHDVGYMNFDGQRLWTISSKMGQDPLVQSLDVDTGETTVLPLPPSGGRRPVLVDNQIWFGTNDFTIQPIDLADGQLGPAIPVYGKPIDLEFDGQRLWILQQVQDCDGQDYLLLQYLVPTD